MKERWDFAINVIFDGADLGDEKILKSHAQNLVLGISSCQVTVRGVRKLLCDSPLLSQDCAFTEPFVEVRRDSLMSMFAQRLAHR